MKGERGWVCEGEDLVFCVLFPFSNFPFRYAKNINPCKRNLNASMFNFSVFLCLVITFCCMTRQMSYKDRQMIDEIFRNICMA